MLVESIKPVLAIRMIVPCALRHRSVFSRRRTRKSRW